jgi:hypothetical protein
MKRASPSPLPMCARRFLMLIFLLTIIFVGGALAIYQWGGDFLLRQATPKGHYEPPPQGGAPVYREANYWIARPDLPDDPSRWLPDGMQPAARGKAAIFYVHPTTYLERDQWNAPFVADTAAEFRARLFVQSQASAFNGAGEIWAPRYRQAAYGAFLLNSRDAQLALGLAYQDVEFAFEEFLRQIGTDRPIILTAHSQGALHLMRLLARHGQDLRPRLVAAYVVGWPVDARADLPTLGIPACRSAEQAGCLLSWLSFREPANPDLILDHWRETKGPTGVDRKRDSVLCVNPLSGALNGSAPAQANRGTLIPSADLVSAAVQPGQVGGRCEDGLLIVDGDIPNLGPYVLPGNNYHVYDYALFWGSIRADAERRLAAWQKR